MEPGKQFTPEEDMSIWRFAMIEQTGYGRTKMWDFYKDRTGSERDNRTLRRRFQSFLLPHLPNTKFHTETKLKWCQEYNLVVERDFLEDLEKDANVELDSRGLVTGWQLKPGCPENRDIQLTDEEFLELTAPVSRRERKHFTAEEDRVILGYVLENLESYTQGKSTFWTEMSNKLESRRHDVLITRFQRTLAPNLHKLDLSIEDQLKIYKACQIAVSVEHLPTLHEYAELETVWGGYIKDYKMRSDRLAKRKNSEDVDGNAKKVKLEDPGESSENLEEEDLLLMRSPEKNTGEQQYIFDQFFTESDNVPQKMIGQRKEAFEKVFFPVEAVNKEDPMVKILQVMERMEQRIVRQEASLEEMKKDLAKSVDEMSNVVNSLHRKMENIRNDVIGSPPDTTTSSKKKKYLLNFKKFVVSIDSPEMKDIEQKIDTALQNLPEDDQSPLPLKAISGVLEVALTSIDI